MNDTKPIEDGGPAFPQGHLDGPEVDPSGMSLRDWFAGQLMAGQAANHAIFSHWLENNPGEPLRVFGEAIIIGSYKVADFALAARKELL